MSTRTGRLTEDTHAAIPRFVFQVPGTLKGTSSLWFRVKGYKMKSAFFFFSKENPAERDKRHLMRWRMR